jgi:hypothetical protein
VAWWHTGQSICLSVSLQFTSPEEAVCRPAQTLLGSRRLPAPCAVLCRPRKGWPERGAITAEKLVVRYRPGLDPVINGLSFNIKGTQLLDLCARRTLNGQWTSFQTDRASERASDCPING